MQTNQSSATQVAEEACVYSFKREDGQWYIHHTACKGAEWAKQDLELTEGAHKVLNMLSNGAERLRLYLSLQPFKDANVLELVEHCEAPRGGGIYLYNPSDEYNSNLFWVCDLALFVFGDIPERIYVKRLSLKKEEALKGTTQDTYPLHQGQISARLLRAI